MSQEIHPENRAAWQVPAFEVLLWQGRQHRWCVVIPVINEGSRIRNLLARMSDLGVSGYADIVLVDGGSTDGSLELDYLGKHGVAGLLLKTGAGKLSAQLRCAYAFAMDQGYEGVVTIDGNDKDDPEAIPRFIKELEDGADFVQGSRFIAGGVSENTPLTRYLAIRLVHAPLLSLASGFRWTDTTQGFRAYSSRLLLDERIATFRDVFQAYELLAYLSYRAPNLEFRCIEIPTIRRYPKGEVPTKISSLRGNFSLLKVLGRSCIGGYDVPEE